MKVASTFLGGAKARLLPVSVPFRYFAAAGIFHCLAWLLMLVGAGAVRGFEGGLGLPVAALHLLTIGVLALTAVGAMFQLLPVATVQPLGRLWPARVVFWIAVPSLLVLVNGFAGGRAISLIGGAAGLAAAFAIFAVAIADNLVRARSMPLVAAHGWAALASLVIALGMGLAMGLDFSKGWLADHQAVAAMHFRLAAFGFMGMLALGLSYVLVPMFALSPSPPQGLGWTSFALAVLGLVLSLAGLLAGARALELPAAASGLGAAGCYLAAMRNVWVSRLRKRLGLSFVLVRLAWALLPLALALEIGRALGIRIPGGSTLIGFIVIVGWLLTFLLGILQRIMPFLASMHADRSSKRPPLISELTPERPLQLHAACHGVALALGSAGLILDSTLIVRLAAVSGLAGALAFLVFMVGVTRRLSGTAGKTAAA